MTRGAMTAGPEVKLVGATAKLGVHAMKGSTGWCNAMLLRIRAQGEGYEHWWVHNVMGGSNKG